jgi:hypothetical protein
MTAPVPKTKFNELFKDATRLLVRWPVSTDDLPLKHIEREATKLRSSGADISGSWEITGICAAARNDVTTALDCVRRAENSPGKDELSALRIAAALAAIGANSEALRIASEAVRRAPNDTEIARTAAGIQSQAGHLVDAAYLGSFGPENRMRTEELLERTGLSKEELEAPFVFARSFLKERAIPVIGSSTRFGGREGNDPPRLIHMYGVNREADEVCALEAELYEEFARHHFVAEVAGNAVVMLTAIRKPKFDGE